MFHKNPIATPGRTACASASPISASRRTTRNGPINPQQMPRSIEPASAQRTAGSVNEKNRNARSPKELSTSSPMRAALAAPAVRTTAASASSAV